MTRSSQVRNLRGVRWVEVVISLSALLLFTSRCRAEPPPAPPSASPAPAVQVAPSFAEAMREPKHNIAQLIASCQWIAAAGKELPIPKFLGCLDSMLTAVDSMVEQECGGRTAELYLASRYETQELMASMVLWGLSGKGPPIGEQATAELLTIGGPVLMHFALLGKARGLELSALRSAQAAQQLTNPRTRSTFEVWNALIREYVFLDWRGATDAQSGQLHQRRLKELRDQLFTIENRLGCLVSGRLLRSIPNPDALTADVVANLPAGSALLEVIQVRSMKAQDVNIEAIMRRSLQAVFGLGSALLLGQRPNLPALSSEDSWGPPHYLALVVSKNQRIAVRDLGLVSDIDRELARFYAQISSDNQGSPIAAAQSVYRRVFLPLVPSLVGVKTLYLALDGNLHAVPFAAFHDGRHYLIDDYAFFYLNSGRDLLRRPSASVSGSSLVLAAPRFSRSDNDHAPGLYSEPFNTSELGYVDGEAETVAALQVGARLLRGGAATEPTVRRALQMERPPRVLHIAAHGLFLFGENGPVRGAPDNRSGLTLVGPGIKDGTTKPAEPALRSYAPAEDLLPALSRSALLLSEGNVPGAASEVERDGVLTGLEVRALDLRGTQLAVLSACSSGVGARQISQGVFGMRTAFFLAGVESMVTSLWPVRDRTTAEFMGTYFRKLRSGTPRLTALHETMKFYKERYKAPYLWAPFIGVGLDAPLRP